MKESLYEQLIKDNPELFEKGECEFSIGNGWYNIMACLLAIITSDLNQARYCLKYEKEHPTNDGGAKLATLEARVEKALEDLPTIVQVKEKFGGLRFYYNGGTPEIHGAVSMAEAMASRTCEVCGSPGERRGGDWIQTLCDSHYRAQEELAAARKQGRRLPAINYDAEDEE